MSSLPCAELRSPKNFYRALKAITNPTRAELRRLTEAEAAFITNLPRADMSAHSPRH